MTVVFEATDGGVEVVDRIENVTFRVATPERSRLREAAPERFRGPVDAAVSLEAASLRFPARLSAFARDPETGETLFDYPAGRGGAVDAGSYELELSSAPVKLYARVWDSPVEVTFSERGTTLSFGGETRVALGARSRHEHPAATVTTTADPEDVMAAVSTLGSALKTTSPERSFPTLRGYPPLVKLGDGLDVSGVDRPDVDARLLVPRSLGAVYSVAPLAYYLGAAVAPADGGAARLVAGGVDHELAPASAGPRAVAREANAILRHAFALDCLVRTEGLYRVPLAERRAVEAAMAADLDWRSLYDLPLGPRVAAYLDVPRSVTEDVLRWFLDADVAADPEHVELLPHLVYRLATVRSPLPDAATRSATSTPPPELEEFLRSGPGGAPPVERDGLADPVDTDAMAHAWVGQRFPLRSAHPTVGAYDRALARAEPDETRISIQVVCNDPEMREETGDLYGFRELLSFSIDVHHDLTRAETRAALRSDSDFLHFVGHVGEDGIQCADGYLDLESFDDAGVEAFVLNGCASYRQGMELVRAGAIGGVVTTGSVGNSFATAAGRSLAGLLDGGFNLYGAVDVVRDHVGIGARYAIVGSGDVTLSQRGGVPTLVTFHGRDGDEYGVEPVMYPTDRMGFGSFGYHTFADDRPRLASGSYGTFTVDRERVASFLEREREPLVLGGELRWTETTALGDVDRAFEE